MENKMLTELQGLLEDINENEIVSHILDGTLISWLSSWKMKCGMLTAFLVENDRANMEELESLRRENLVLKMRIIIRDYYWQIRIMRYNVIKEAKMYEHIETK